VGGDPRHRREVHRQSGNRHRLYDRAYRHKSGTLRLWPAAFPHLRLGCGNGPFGIGWNLSLPAITRKTEKGLPKYCDAEDSDVFVISGAEDLVPAFQSNPDGTWLRDTQGNLVADEKPRDGYMVKRYRPRIEGLFARIERWTRISDGDTHWRSISKDNILTVYGSTPESRIADPADPSHVFSWLICQSYDDKGNAMVYAYAAENGDNVDLSQINERSRVRTANRYLKYIRYGNRQPLLIDPTQPSFRQPHVPAPDFSAANWMFEVVFDYGEGHYQEMPPDADGRIFAAATLRPPPNGTWPVRLDPFSTYRSCFEVRSYRLCRRVLLFHHFPDELGVDDCLVRSTESSPPIPIITLISMGPNASFADSDGVEQRDSEEFGTLAPATNLNKGFHVPPTLTKTWFHTGAYFRSGERINAYPLPRRTSSPAVHLCGRIISASCEAPKGC
jgi:hypothetical protein